AALTKRLTVERATPIELSLPGDALTLIELAQLEAKPAGKLPDLAISREDVSLSPDRRTVTVTVHNIGSLASPKAEVVIQDEKGATLGSAPLKELAPPDDLQPKTERLAIALRSPVPDKLQVTLDPGRTLDEITRENNGVSGEFRR
ncbi:MAG: hypothetical protein FJ279_29705, partial [Planctomycetes bacterium]|nr:hypothetical protein [Planctomycetota bacterium]